MNKYVIIGIVLVAIMGLGFGFSMLNQGFKCEPGMGEDKQFTVISKKLEWTFEPESITVNQCDRVKVTVINEDNFDHGFAIDAFGVSQRLPANGTIEVEFTATKSGTFKFYCSVSCSSSDNPAYELPDGLVQTGKHAGEKRDHWTHIGEFLVEMYKSLTGQ